MCRPKPDAKINLKSIVEMFFFKVLNKVNGSLI